MDSWNVYMYVYVFNFEESHAHCVNQSTKYQMCIDIESEHNYVISSGVIQRINYMFRPLYLAIIRLCLAYRVTALHTSVSKGRQDLVHNGQIHELN